MHKKNRLYRAGFFVYCWASHDSSTKSAKIVDELPKSLNSSTKSAKIVDELPKSLNSSTKSAKNKDEPRENRSSSMKRAKIVDESTKFYSALPSLPRTLMILCL